MNGIVSIDRSDADIIFYEAAVDLPAQANFLRCARGKICCFNERVLSRDWN